MRADALVVGGGHNGLAAAAYLARKGLHTMVLERREIPGGACVTEELWPGFHVSRAAYVAGLLRPSVIRELALERHGLRLIPRSPSSYTPLPDGPGLLLWPQLERTCEEIRRFSARDAERYPAYESFLDGLARAFEPLLDATPPDPGRPGIADLATLWRVGRGLVGLRRNLARGLSLVLGPARRTLQAWFESEPLCATLATDAVIGAWASPSSPGTGYVLFHHVMGETNGARGVWAYVEGGMGRLSEALAGAAQAAGAEIRTGAQVVSLRTGEGRVRGVVLAGGEEIESPLVLSSADPARTFLELTPPDALPEGFADQVRTLDFRSPVLKINVALERLPRFRHGSAQGVGPEHAGTIHLGATDLDALDRSFQTACQGRLPERPMVELTIPSALDPSLAPEGRHVASLFVQHVPCVGQPVAWDAWRDAFADRVFALVDEVAPGFSESVLHREVLAPPDLESVFGLTGGNIFHGAMTPDRLLFLRPLPDWARYRTPLAGLYLCGAGAHPGGGVMAACGRNAARQVLRDLRRR
jgi:phytoene dehydrogenase-like protein